MTKTKVLQQQKHIYNSPAMCPRPEAVPVHAMIFPVCPGKSFIRIDSMAPIAAASAAPPIIL